jgi:TolB-like protein
VRGCPARSWSLAAQMPTCHEIVVGFLRQTCCAIRRVSVRLSDAASGISVEERSWFNDSTDAAALAQEVAHHIASSVSGRVDLEATISVSDEG